MRHIRAVIASWLALLTVLTLVEIQTSRHASVFPASTGLAKLRGSVQSTEADHFWSAVFPGYLEAFGTLTLAIVAVWGDGIRRALMPPKLKLRILSTGGVEALTSLGHWTHYYHLNIENERRYNPVRDVRVYVLKIEHLHNDKRRGWEGIAPMVWRNEGPFSVSNTRVLGHPAEVDLCVLSPVGLSLCWGVWNLGETMADPSAVASHLRLTLQARGIEADSNILAVEIKWDGTIPTDRASVHRHIQVMAV